MIEWTTLPRGSLRCAMNGQTALVWHVGEGWRWHTDDGDTYLGSGIEPSEDEACDAAIRFMSGDVRPAEGR